MGLPAISVGEFIHTNTVHRLHMVIPSCQSQVAIIFSLNSSFPLIPCRQRNSVKCSFYDNHLNFSVQNKLRDSVRLESGCRIWNMARLQPRPSTVFILHATCTSDTLLTSVNSKCWLVGICKCPLCACTQPC